MEKIPEDRQCLTAAMGVGRVKQRNYPNSTIQNSFAEKEDVLHKLFSEGQNQDEEASF